VKSGELLNVELMSLSGQTNIIEAPFFYHKVVGIIVPFTLNCGRIYPQADG
jgi:hypothetical protein